MTDNVVDNLRNSVPPMTNGQNRYRASRLVLVATLWVTLFVLSVKVSAAWVTRSLSLLAESLHTLIASFSTLVSLLALTQTERPTGSQVWGHGKREAAIAIAIAAFLGYATINLFGMSVSQLAGVGGRVSPFTVRVSLPLLQLLGVVVAASLGLAFMGVYQAKVLNSPLLRFNAGQLLRDAWLTTLALLALLGVWWGVMWLDVVAAILFTFVAITSFWRTLNWQLPLLVQQTAIAPEVLAQIARSVGGVTHCYQIRSQGIVGRMVYVQMHLILHPDFNHAANAIAERIEGAIRARYGSVQTTFYIDDELADVQENGQSDRYSNN